MDDILVSVCIALFTAYLVKFLVKRFNPKLPPGPWGLPFWGYGPFLSKDTFRDYWKLHQKFGPVFGYWCGRQYVVVLGSLTSIKEAFGKEEFTYRPPGILKLAPECDNVAHMSGPAWKESRKFTMLVFKNLAKDAKTEERMKEEISVDIELLGSGREVDLYQFFRRSLVNNFLSMISGKAFKEGDQRLDDIYKYFRSLNKNMETAIGNFFEADFGPLSFLRRALRPTPECDGLQEGEKIFWSEIEAWERRSEQDIRDDYLDLYGVEMQKNQGKESSFSRENMLGNALMLVLTGGDTVKSKLVWLFLCMAQHQDKQEKLYREVVDRLGKDRTPCWSDKDSLSYAVAFVMEVTRCKTITPAIDHHRAGMSGTICGFHVPKDSILSANIHAVHYDQTLWGDPMTFRPERFLSEDGRIVQSDCWIPFLIGKRSCPAEKVSMMQLFLIATSFVQKFLVLPPEGGLSLDDEEGGTLTAKKPIVYFKKRT